MRKMPAVQKGLGMSAMLFIIVVVIVVLTLIFKLGPSYMTFMTLKSVMNTVAEAPEPYLGGKSVILRAVDSGMTINDVRSVDIKSFTVKKAGEETFDLTVDYEQRQHLFFNIDTVLTFHYTVVVKGR